MGTVVVVGVAMKVTRRGSLSVRERLAQQDWSAARIMQNNRNHDEYKDSRGQMSRDNGMGWDGTMEKGRCEGLT